MLRVPPEPEDISRPPLPNKVTVWPLAMVLVPPESSRLPTENADGMLVSVPPARGKAPAEAVGHAAAERAARVELYNAAAAARQGAAVVDGPRGGDFQHAAAE